MTRLETELVAVEKVDDESAVLARLQHEPCHILVTDNVELIRKVRAGAPFMRSVASAAPSPRVTQV